MLKRYIFYNTIGSGTNNTKPAKKMGKRKDIRENRPAVVWYAQARIVMPHIHRIYIYVDYIV